jgi:2-iminobutanoate/2-iminopropanoate deaminase
MKEIINTKHAPAAIGPYSQAVKVDNLLFISGQIPIDPTSGSLVASDIKEQTRQVLKNLFAVIEAAQMKPDNIVKCSCFLKNMSEFADFNSIYTEFLGTVLPARECVEVARLPRDVLVEISAILVSGY